MGLCILWLDGGVRLFRMMHLRMRCRCVVKVRLNLIGRRLAGRRWGRGFGVVLLFIRRLILLGRLGYWGRMVVDRLRRSII